MSLSDAQVVVLSTFVCRSMDAIWNEPVKTARRKARRSRSLRSPMADVSVCKHSLSLCPLQAMQSLDSASRPAAHAKRPRTSAPNRRSPMARKKERGCSATLVLRTLKQASTHATLTCKESSRRDDHEAAPNDARAALRR